MFNKDVVIDITPWPEIGKDIANQYCVSGEDIGLTTFVVNSKEYIYVCQNHVGEKIYVKRKDFPEFAEYLLNDVGFNPS